MSEKSTIPEGLTDYLRPTLRIFLSVDIVNSTAFKQAAGNRVNKKQVKPKEDLGDDRPEEPWFSPISLFYRAIELNLAAEWKKREQSVVESNIEVEIGPAPTLWKAAGDELIYVKTVSDPLQVLAAVRAWIAAVASHREDLKKDFHTLDLKASAWLAGFPVNNAEIVLRRKPETSNPVEDVTYGDHLLINFERLAQLHKQESQDNGDMFRDFIGPSMDTGFRVSALATPRKFAVTIDLAYVISHAATSIQHNEIPLLEEPIFQYDGRVPLKGVSGGAPYPFFWIDTKDLESLLEKEDSLMSRRRLGCAEVFSFCASFFAERHDRGPFMTPYIIGSPSNSPFSHVPEPHKERLAGLAYWAKGLQARIDERAALLETNEPVSAESGASAVNLVNLIAGELQKLFKSS